MVVRAYTVCIRVTPECRRMESEMIRDGWGHVDKVYHDMQLTLETYTTANSGLKILNLPVYMDNLEIGGDFLMIFRRENSLYIQNSSQVYIKTDNHIQSMTPNRQYASPASNFQPTKQFPSYKTPDP